MRAYYFGNFYLSSIQQGIQAGHVTHELFVKYPDRHIPASQGDRLWEWAEHHKTMILLNGGMASRLMDTEHFLKDEDNPYPWTSFREEKNALNGSITSVGIILPAKIYVGASTLRENKLPWSFFAEKPSLQLNSPEIHSTVAYTRFEALLMYKLNEHKLAT